MFANSPRGNVGTNINEHL